MIFAFAKTDALFQAMLNGDDEDVALLCDAHGLTAFLEAVESTGNDVLDVLADCIEREHVRVTILRW